MSTHLNQFTLFISVNRQRREFNFRQRSNKLFDGNTTDDRGERFYFALFMENESWKFADTAMPAWLKATEPLVVAAFSAELEVVH